MEGSTQYILRAIIGYKDNGYNSFGELDAKHVEDIAKLLTQYATETIFELVERINKGESIIIGDRTISLQKRKSGNRIYQQKKL